MQGNILFSIAVDEEIDLALVQPSFAPHYLKLLQADYDHLAQWLPWADKMKTEDDFVAFVKRCLHDYAVGTGMTCGILYRGELVGNISFNSIDQELKKVEMGYWLASSAQGNGIITRACQAMMRIAFEQLGMEKVQISVATENRSSRAVCERLNMTLEGVISNAEKLRGQLVSHACYAKRRPDRDQ